ncbi:hypothetical protein [Trinickia fusca]|uniref:Uncharacterized protein n=1 Tax=Trinickia fusca TaxID=2419777 RepID=A0A494X2N9_9BURK|nr:hypothetical protein [Trinickia fusca]RKP43881.1 hypothetical protein D7S89_24715 [Trinickia fusca]
MRSARTSARHHGAAGGTRLTDHTASSGSAAASDVARALDALATVWHVDLPVRAGLTAARLLAPAQHDAQQPFAVWLDQVCSPQTLAMLTMIARDNIRAQFAAMRERGRMRVDLIQEIVTPLWPDTLASWAGLPDQQRRRLRHLARMLDLLSDPARLSSRRLVALIESLDELRRLFRAAYRAPRHLHGKPNPNLFSALELAWTPAIGTIEDEAAFAATQLLFTGSEAAWRRTGPFIAKLLAKPDAMTQLSTRRDDGRLAADRWERAQPARRTGHRQPAHAKGSAWAPLASALAHTQTRAVLDVLGDPQSPVERGDGAHWRVCSDGTRRLEHLSVVLTTSSAPRATKTEFK